MCNYENCYFYNEEKENNCALGNIRGKCDDYEETEYEERDDN